MYRCTECHTEFEECPDFCDCGNDTFEEVFEEEEYSPEPERPAPQRRKLTREEREELEREALDKKKSLIALVVCLCLCVLVLFLPPHREKKMVKVKRDAQAANVKLPELKTYWDDSVPSQYRKSKDPILNLPILNERISSISPKLREYLQNVGGEFTRKWNPAIVSGAGECKIEFVINKEGVLTTKRIIASSHNESLDDSVLLALSNINNLDIPPEDYKGERIFIAFKVTEGQGSKVFYPSK